MIRTNDTNPLCFDLPGGHFQVRLKNVEVISITMFVTVKNSLKNTMITKKQ